MKRRNFLKLLGATAAVMVVTPAYTLERFSKIGLKKTFQDTYADVKADALKLHAQEMKRAFLYGICKEEF